MIHIHMTIKDSVRFPGKNTKLWPYTANWLASELLRLNEPYSVTLTARGAFPLDPALIPQSWDILQLDYEPYTHEDDQRAACHYAAEKHEPSTPFEDTLHVQLLLTQPLRRPELLVDAVKALRENGDKTAHVISYNERMENGAFRRLEDGIYGKAPKDHERTKLIDGAIWAWYGDPACIFKRVNAIGVKNATPWGTIDIDAPEDLPHALPAIWAEVMLGQQPATKN